jgi:adenylate cyclase class IV
MGREIEIKIPLTDAEYEKIFKVISGDAKLDGLDVAVDGLEHLLKTDTYFSRYDSREESKAAGEPQVIRIRSESSAGDKTNERSYFCIKRKTIENGIELNREDETFVENADVIRDLLLFSGYHQFFEKNKDAYGVHCQSVVLPGCDFHLELERVNGLKYVEVEVTDGSDKADDVRLALEKFMEQFGLDTSKRDKRSWMEIINRSAV